MGNHRKDICKEKLKMSSKLEFYMIDMEGEVMKREGVGM